MVPYLVTADLVNTVVAATLAFGPLPLYRWYGELSGPLGIDAGLDQQLAAGIMWIPGSIVYLVPAMVIAARHFGIAASMGVAPPRSVPLPVLAPTGRGPEGGDLLRAPVIGSLLKSPGFRLGVRLFVLLVLVAIVLDGFLGTPDAPMNLAGTLPWTHWRGVVVVGAIVVGNVACFGCPLIAPRSLLRRWIRPSRRWPAALRSKWLAAALVVGWLVAYEAFDPWDGPALTAWVLVGLVLGATVVDLVFEGASFCRHVCPLGQFQMACSTMSTRTIAAREPRTCSECTTRDCLHGGPRGPGCGLELLVPAKRGNLDCTFCLDCVTACPHDNVGILPATPGVDLADPRPRSGLRSLVDRPDVATLRLAVTVGGLVNAVGMTAPVVAMLDRMQDATVGRRLLEGGGTLVAILGGVLLAWILAIPPLGEALNRFGHRGRDLGVAIWIVHLGFHLVTGWTTAEAPGRVIHDLGAVDTPPGRRPHAARRHLLAAAGRLLVLSFGIAVRSGSHGGAFCGKKVGDRDPPRRRRGSRPACSRWCSGRSRRGWSSSRWTCVYRGVRVDAPRTGHPRVARAVPRARIGVGRCGRTRDGNATGVGP